MRACVCVCVSESMATAGCRTGNADHGAGKSRSGRRTTPTLGDQVQTVVQQRLAHVALLQAGTASQHPCTLANAPLQQRKATVWSGVCVVCRSVCFVCGYNGGVSVTAASRARANTPAAWYWRRASRLDESIVQGGDDAASVRFLQQFEGQHASLFTRLFSCVKLEFHDADTDTDILARILARM